MKRSKLAVLGLAALALAAMSAFVASSAQATGTPIGEFTCLENHTTHVHCDGYGVQAPTHDESQSDHTFEAGFATLTCETAEFAVTTDEDGTIAQPKATPTYENCTASPGGLPAEVNTEGCEYQFTVEEAGGATEGDYTGSAKLSGCNAGEITVTIKEEGAVRCTIHVPEQETIKPIYFRNMEEVEPTDVTVEARNAAVQSSFTPGPGRTLLGGCGVFSENATSHYTGNTTVGATNATTNNPVDLRFSPF